MDRTQSKEYSLKVITLSVVIMATLLLTTCSQDVAEPVVVETYNECGFECTPSDILLMEDVVNYSRGYQPRMGVVQVPVSLNVIRNDSGNGGVTQADIDFQFNRMNEIYQYAGIEFVICGDINFVNNSELHVSDNYDQYQLRQLYNRGDIINMYVVGDVVNSGSSVCGYAYYPGGLEVVFLSTYCFNNGSTLSHEMGHFFGLLHTHGASNSPNSTEERADGSNGDTTGDMIQDTPSDPKLSGNVDYYCNYNGDFLDIVGQPHNPDPNNMMSYSRKECRDFFSQGQLERMNYILLNYRDNLTCDYVEPDGSEDNPFIIDDLTRNRVFKNGDEFTNNPTVYYKRDGNLNLNSFKLRMRGQVKLTVTGDVNGTTTAKISSQRGADICVLGDINTMSGAWRTGTFNENCGTPRGSIDNPIVIKRSFSKNRGLSNGNCETTETKYYLILEDVDINEFDFTIRGRVNLTILGDVNGSGTLIAKKCGAITVNGNINVETLEQSGGSID